MVRFETSSRPSPSILVAYDAVKEKNIPVLGDMLTAPKS